MARMLRAVGVVALALIPALLIWRSSPSGAALSQDSVSYLATARSLASGSGLTTFTGDPLTLFPPGLPVLLGALQWMGWNAPSAAVALNAVCAALLVVGAYMLARRCGFDQVLAFVVTAFTSLSTATVSVFSWLWTEPLFSVLVLGALFVLVGMVRDHRVGWWSAIGVSALVSTATAVRYVGLVLIGVAIFGVWLSLRESQRGMKWRRIAAVGAMSSIGLVVVVARNLAVGSGPLGERYPGTRTIEGAINATVEVLGSYVAPPQATSLTIEAGVLVLVVLAVGVWVAFIRRDESMLLLAGFVAVYLAAIIWSQAATRLDSASLRLLAPAFVPMLVVAAYGLTETVRAMTAHLGRSGASVVWAGVWVGLLLVLSASVVQTMRFVSETRSNGLGLGPVAATSELAAAATAVGESAGTASNNPWVVYLAKGSPPVRPLPPSSAEWPPGRVQLDTNRLVQAVKDGSVGLAAVYDDGEAIEPLDRLAEAGVAAELVGRFSDGSLYTLSPMP